MDFELLRKLCSVHAPSGSEFLMTEFILNHVKQNESSWTNKPIVHSDNEFGDAVVLVFGKPTTAIFAHIDSIGFTTGYGSDLIKIGSPRTKSGYKLVGEDSQGAIECTLNKDEEGRISYLFEREIDRGTTLTFKPSTELVDGFLESQYLDNRLGVYNALKVAETLENGIIVFSCYEEHGGGGSAQFIARYIWDEYKVRQALISDITWVTEGIHHGNGVAISMRDSGIPRKKFLNKIIELAKESGARFQLEVESAGGSDGTAIQKSSAPTDWCFIGAPEDNVHSPFERVDLVDVEAMIELYQYLMKKL